MSIPVTETWKDDLVGRDWEVFWRPDGDYEDDWYDAKIISFLRTQGEDSYVFSVSFVGEDFREHEMVLSPSVVRPRLVKADGSHEKTSVVSRPKHCEGSQQLPSLEWAQSLAGYECEIFWKADGAEELQETGSVVPMEISSPAEHQTNDDTNETVTNNEDAASLSKGLVDNKNNDNEAEKESDDEEDDADWYEAHIISCLPPVSAGALPLFKLTFAGDDSTYEMPLKPELVRPSARAWIRRSKALLEETREKKSFQDWERTLPCDTRTLNDRKELDAIRDCIQTRDYPAINISLPEPPAQTPFPSPEDQQRVSRLVELIRSQIYLREQLAPIEANPEEKKNSPPTEAYVNYLVQCLKKMEECCQWHYQCWKLHTQLLAATSSVTEKLDPPILLQGALNDAKRAMASLVSMDISLAGSKRKRRPSSAQASSRRAKRRRKKKGFATFWAVGESGERSFNEDIEAEDLLSAQLVQRLVDDSFNNDTRWYAASLGAMLKSLSRNIVAPLVKWERRAEYYLGDRDVLDVEASDGETSEEDTDDDEDEEGEEKSSPASQQDTEFVKFEEIQALVDAASSDVIFSKIELSEKVKRLEQKLREVIAFEEKAWPIVGAVLDDTGDQCWKEKDATYLGLQKLLSEAMTGNTLKNVEPIGLAGSTLTRSVLRNAMIYREWFLDLKYAESSRERVSFVENVVSRLSKLPPLPSRSESRSENELDVSRKIDLLTPRVQSLWSKHIDHAALFNRCRSMLRDSSRSQGDRQGLMTEQGIRDAIDELEKAKVISVEEEMVTVRLDILQWERQAEAVYSAATPVFADLEDLFDKLERLVQGKSANRLRLIKDIRGNAEVDLKVLEFARENVDAIIETASLKTRSLYTRSSAWKKRAELILDSLISFGNAKAGAGTSSQKNPTMIDIKRIEDLLDEYSSLEVDLSSFHEKLRFVHENASAWASPIVSFLSDPGNSLDACLDAVKRLGSQRPNGIIMNPTRQAIDMLEELLQWYSQVQCISSSPEVHTDSLESLLLQGIDIVRLYSESRSTAVPRFVVPSDAVEVLMARRAGRRPVKGFSLAKFTSPLACTVLRHVTKESTPLLALLFWTWQVYVENFVSLNASKEVPPARRSLVRAKELLLSRPSPSGSLCEPFEGRVFKHVDELKALVESGNMVELEAQEALSQSKRLLRSISSSLDSIREHHSLLKDLLATFKSRTVENTGVVLCQTIEQQLERDLKIFSWLVRTVPYEVLLPGGHEDTEQRVPWDFLVSLYERLPPYGQESGQFAGVVLRVKELYEAADKWQQDISSLTMLSLRGGKRRNQAMLSPGKGEEAEAKESSSVINMKKIGELCLHPILKKVAMPREAGIQEFLQNTTKFETALHEFLGRDYDGESPDRTAYPSAGSLMGSDGTFLLLRLTGSPMFQALKRSIVDIAQIADKVFAETPGKAAFDWIAAAVEWIEELHSAICVSKHAQPIFSTKTLSLSKDDASNLFEKGRSILLDVPDDLRKTLSHHKIQVYSTKEEKLTVKTSKGGAHHAVGVAAIRWCPFLYDSLKADLTTLQEWEKTLFETIVACNKFTTQEGESKSRDAKATGRRLYEFRSMLDDHLEKAADLVVSPASSDISQAQELLDAINKLLQQNPDSGALKAHVNSKYKDGSSVVDDRFVLLDGLAQRKALAYGNVTANIDADIKKGPFRSAARLLLAEGLCKGMRTMSVVPQGEMRAFCSVKAWEIENALFDRFQGELGESRITDEYKHKARNLKKSIEDVANVTLCARVLSGKVTAVELVRMKPEQLANPMTRQLRANAEAKKNIIQNRPYLPEEAKKEPPQPSPVGCTSDSRKSSPLKKPPAPAAPKLASVGASTSPKNRPSKPASFGELVKTARSNRPPPPPPSLVPTLGSGAANPGESQNARLLDNGQGGDRFIISVAENSYTFMGGFYIEDDTAPNVEGLVPEQLSEKRRTPGKAFAQFIKDKLKSKKWQPVLLRLSTWSEQDARQYKKFYKDYESRDRIATFILNDKEKMYLVTPKFQRLLRDQVSFEKQTSAYGLILRRIDCG